MRHPLPFANMHSLHALEKTLVALLQFVEPYLFFAPSFRDADQSHEILSGHACVWQAVINLVFEFRD